MDSRYSHQDSEQFIYNLWEKADAFKPSDEVKSGTLPFSIIMPPPNANDPLHIGHAMFISIEDIMIRFHRMKGDDTVWIPGTDHAGIETQYVFEKKLAKDGKSRFNFDRATLFKMIWEYVQENSGVAVDQMKKIGASADWGRYKFTLDPDIVDKVTDTFLKMQ
jgi:valyl-tRNA synthetase